MDSVNTLKKSFTGAFPSYFILQGSRCTSDSFEFFPSDSKVWSWNSNFIDNFEMAPSNVSFFLFCSDVRGCEILERFLQHYAEVNVIFGLCFTNQCRSGKAVLP
jgi:hypothetical protein